MWEYEIEFYWTFFRSHIVLSTNWQNFIFSHQRKMNRKRERERRALLKYIIIIITVVIDFLKFAFNTFHCDEEFQVQEMFKVKCWRKYSRNAFQSDKLVKMKQMKWFPTMTITRNKQTKKSCWKMIWAMTTTVYYCAIHRYTVYLTLQSINFRCHLIWKLKRNTFPTEITIIIFWMLCSSH